MGTLSILDLNIYFFKCSGLIFTRRGSPVDKRHSPTIIDLVTCKLLDGGDLVVVTRGMRTNILLKCRPFAVVEGNCFEGFLGKLRVFQ